MNALIIIGNDFATAYSILILREGGGARLRLGHKKEHFIPLDTEVDNSYLDTVALTIEAERKEHH